MNASVTRPSSSRSSTNVVGSYSHGMPYQSRTFAYSSSAGLAKRGGSEPQYAWKTGVSGTTAARVATASDGSRALVSAVPADDRSSLRSPLRRRRISCPDLMERAIAEINDLKPDIVVCSGDLTTFGFKEEYAAAKRYLDRIECEALVVVPGEPRLAERRLRPLRGAVRRAQLGAARKAASRSSPSTRPSPTSTTARSAAAATAGSRSSSRPSRPSCASSCCTTTCCRSRARAASATSSTTPATRSSACSARACTSCSPATSTCRTRGSSRTCSSSTPAPSRRCACAATRGPVTTSSRSTGTHVDVWRRYPFHGQERIIQFDLATGEYEKYTGRIEREVTATR